MYLADYHMHSKYSFDGREELDLMCEEAIKKGLSEIAITDHMDIFSQLPYGEMMNFDVPGGKKVIMDVAGLYQELQEVKMRYENRLVVRVGTELGQPQVNSCEARAFLEKYPMDFVIGSVHNMENDLDVYYYDFSKIDAEAMYERYLMWLLELAKTGDFDVCGHLTYPLRYLYEREHKTLNLTKWYDQFKELFQILIEKGRGIELNISGMYKAMRDTMPTFEIIKLYRECGGEIITIGSDAHQLEHIGLFQLEAQSMLAAAGFSYITCFEKRKPIFHKL